MISVSVRDRGRGELRASKSPLRYLSVARRTSREAARAIVVDMLPRRAAAAAAAAAARRIFPPDGVGVPRPPPPLDGASAPV